MTTYVPPPQPEPFLEVRVHKKDISPSLCGLCVGYECGSWRNADLVSHIFNWLPEFALAPSEHAKVNIGTCVAMIKRAARTVYETKKFRKRGEFGELFLHAVIRQVHNSLPAISKIYYKSAMNDPVKGFDAVHVVGPPDEMELWLGEAKFYKTIQAAIKSVTDEIRVHVGRDYLKSEFILIGNKVDDNAAHATKLKKLLSPTTSLDEVFKRACIPVLLTYESSCVASHDKCSAEYIAKFEAEVVKHRDAFAKSLSKHKLPEDLRIHLFLMPIHKKDMLVEALDQELKSWQGRS